MITEYLQRKADNFWLFDVNFGSSGKLAKLLLADILFIREIECVQTKHKFFSRNPMFYIYASDLFPSTHSYARMHAPLCLYAVCSMQQWYSVKYIRTSIFIYIFDSICT